MTSTAASERPAEPMTPAQQQRTRLDQFMSAVEKRADQIGTLLADSNIEPKLFLETCRRALMRDAELINANPASFIQAALNCAADGLVPDGRKATIVRYKGSAQYVPMYQGLLDIAYRSGNFQSIEARVVYEGDDFDFALGDNPYIHHKRTLESDTAKIRGAYAVARTTNGGVFREVMGKKELDKVRAVSKATRGPNADWPGEMARKAPVRRLWKYLPRTQAMDRVVTHDDETYDQSALVIANDPQRRLAPGFASAIEAPAAPTVAAEPEATADHIEDADFEDAVDAPFDDGLPVREDGAPADDFPSDRPAEPAFDVIAWAADFNRSLSSYSAVDAMREEWLAHKDDLKASSPALFKEVNAAVAARAAEIAGDK